MMFGYARISTTDQNTVGQADELAHAGADQIFVDRGSGVNAHADRPEIARLLDALRPGDEVAVHALGRSGRGLSVVQWLTAGGDPHRAAPPSPMPRCPERVAFR